MANDLTTHLVDPAQMISLPALQKLRRISVGTVTWPGQPTATYLPAGASLSTETRGEAERMHAGLVAAVTPREDQQTREARFAIITKLLLSKPVPGASSAVGKARGEAYLEALDDVPPWAIAAAVRKWRRGEYGDAYDYTWAPAEAVLRKLSLLELVPLREALHHVAGLLNAKPLDDLMREGEARIDPRVVEGFKQLSAELHTGKRPETVIAEDRKRRAQALGRQADKLAAQEDAA